MDGLGAPLALMAALVAIYVLMFRGFFGKRHGPSTASEDGPAWGAALMGGFAAASIAEAVPSLAEVTFALAAVVGTACGLTLRAGFLSWPAAVLGGAATLATAVHIWTTAPRRGVGSGYVVLMLCMVGLFAAGEALRLLAPRVPVLSGRGAPIGLRALGYFSAVDLTNFLLAPGGVGILDWARTGVVAIIVWLSVILLPILLGASHPAFLGMFCGAASLALLYLSFVGLGDQSFVEVMGYLASSMLAYWITRWMIRGFGGRRLLSDR